MPTSIRASIRCSASNVPRRKRSAKPRSRRCHHPRARTRRRACPCGIEEACRGLPGAGNFAARDGAWPSPGGPDSRTRQAKIVSHRHEKSPRPLRELPHGAFEVVLPVDVSKEKLSVIKRNRREAGRTFQAPSCMLRAWAPCFSDRPVRHGCCTRTKPFGGCWIHTNTDRTSIDNVVMVDVCCGHLGRLPSDPSPSGRLDAW